MADQNTGPCHGALLYPPARVPRVSPPHTLSLCRLPNLCTWRKHQGKNRTTSAAQGHNGCEGHHISLKFEKAGTDTWLQWHTQCDVTNWAKESPNTHYHGGLLYGIQYQHQSGSLERPPQPEQAR